LKILSGIGPGKSQNRGFRPATKYKYISKILSLPNEQSLFRTCAYLNVISYKIVDDDKDLSTKKVKWSSKSKDCLEISMLIQKIEKELAVTLSYQSINVEELY
jgi:hypothetical protein